MELMETLIANAVKEKERYVQAVMDCLTLDQLDMAMVNLLSAIKCESAEKVLRAMNGETI